MRLKHLVSYVGTTLATALLCTLPVAAQGPIFTNSLVNGRFWASLSLSSKMGFLMGYREGIKGAMMTLGASSQCGKSEDVRKIVEI